MPKKNPPPTSYVSIAKEEIKNATNAKKPKLSGKTDQRKEALKKLDESEKHPAPKH
jgi:hypothetical protein